MNPLDRIIGDTVNKVKKKAVILRLLSNLDDAVITIYTDKDNDEVVIKAKIREEENEL